MTKLKLFHIVEKNMQCSTNFRDKLPFAKRFILIYCLTANVTHYQTFYRIEIELLVFKLYQVLFVIFQVELWLPIRVEK